MDPFEKKTSLEEIVDSQGGSQNALTASGKSQENISLSNDVHERSHNQIVESEVQAKGLQPSQEREPRVNEAFPPLNENAEVNHQFWRPGAMHREDMTYSDAARFGDPNPQGYRDRFKKQYIETRTLMVKPLDGRRHQVDEVLQEIENLGIDDNMTTIQEIDKRVGTYKIVYNKTPGDMETAASIWMEECSQDHTVMIPVGIKGSSRGSFKL